MKYIICLISLVLLTVNTFVQTPEKMSYQVVIRDNTHALIINSKVNIRIIIKQGSSSNSIALIKEVT